MNNTHIILYNNAFIDVIFIDYMYIVYLIFFLDFNHSMYLFSAFQKGEVDRALFPHYVQFLSIASRVDQVKDIFVAKVLDHPFQLGLVLAHPQEERLENHHKTFLVCFNNFISQPEQVGSYTRGFCRSPLNIGKY